MRFGRCLMGRGHRMEVGGPPLRLDQLDHQNLFARGLFGLFSRSGSWLTRRWSQANQCWVRKQSLRYIRQPPIHQKDGKRVILHHKVFCLTTRERRDEYAVKRKEKNQKHITIFIIYITCHLLDTSDTSIQIGLLGFVSFEGLTSEVIMYKVKHVKNRYTHFFYSFWIHQIHIEQYTVTYYSLLQWF